MTGGKDTSAPASNPEAQPLSCTSDDLSAASELHVLARLFRYPEGEQDLAPAADVPRLRRELSDLSLIQIQSEYVRLFVSGLCPPWGSIYLEGYLQGASTAAIREICAQQGIRPGEPPDQFAAECAILCALARAAATDSDASSAMRFLVQHLATWAPTFLSRVEATDATGYFREAAAWGRHVIEQARRELV